MPDSTGPLTTPALRFRRSARLVRREDFQRVFDQARRSADGSVTVLGCNNALAIARLGMVVPRRVLAKAIERNRVKRVIRESFLRHQPTLAGVDVVVLVRAGIRSLDNAAIRERLARHWNNVRQRCKA